MECLLVKVDVIIVETSFVCLSASESYGGNDRAVTDSFASLIGLTSRYMLPFVIFQYISR